MSILIVSVIAVAILALLFAAARPPARKSASSHCADASASLIHGGIGTTDANCSAGDGGGGDCGGGGGD